MKTIWKFMMIAADRQIISMPIGAKVLCVKMQGDQPHLWAEVCSDAKLEHRTFEVF